MGCDCGCKDCNQPQYNQCNQPPPSNCGCNQQQFQCCGPPPSQYQGCQSCHNQPQPQCNQPPPSNCGCGQQQQQNQPSLPKLMLCEDAQPTTTNTVDFTGTQSTGDTTSNNMDQSGSGSNDPPNDQEDIDVIVPDITGMGSNDPFHMEQPLGGPFAFQKSSSPSPQFQSTILPKMPQLEVLSEPFEIKEELTIPLHFHIMTGVNMEVKGKFLEPWVTSPMLSESVIPEINRIFHKAGIKFKATINVEPPTLVNKHELIQTIQKSDRTNQIEGNTSLLQLLDQSKRHPSSLNIYLFPFIGSTREGFYSRNRNPYIAVGVWTDKATNGSKPPTKTNLTENTPFRIGSLSRTIAHEIGHSFGLFHPVSDLYNTPIRANQGRLMGGTTKGYNLTTEEIEIARNHIEMEM